jgi:hypothetical protein
MEIQETQNKVVFAGMQIELLLSIDFLSPSPRWVWTRLFQRKMQELEVSKDAEH